MEYAKPGDALDIERPVLFGVDAKSRIEIDDALFPNPYELSGVVWRKDSRAFTFEYNERGHQAYRVVEVDGATGAARAAVDERAKTFFTYSEWGGKKYRRDLDDGREVVWMSERSGWNHLYLLDGTTGAVKNPITTGEWVVRSVDRVDEAKRQVWFQACGVVPGQDPYFVDAYRANLDGTGLVRLTEPGANHVVTYSSDGAYFVDTRSRVDLAPVTEIRSAADGTAVMTVEKGDISALVAAGWKPPEVFVAKGRDGSDRHLGHRLPAVELRSGAQVPGHRVHLRRAARFLRPQVLPRLLVTSRPWPSWASSSASATAWARATAPRPSTTSAARTSPTPASPTASSGTRPWRPRTRPTTSPGSASTGTPPAARTPSPASSSTPSSTRPASPPAAATTTAWTRSGGTSSGWAGRSGPSTPPPPTSTTPRKLQGKLLLIVGEMDTNVDPASTMQVVNALIKANKVFDLLVIPGAGHGMGGAYGERKMYDFFVRNLLGAEPPNWNDPAKTN